MLIFGYKSIMDFRSAVISINNLYPSLTFGALLGLGTLLLRP